MLNATTRQSISPEKFDDMREAIREKDHEQVTAKISKQKSSDGANRGKDQPFGEKLP